MEIRRASRKDTTIQIKLRHLAYKSSTYCLLKYKHTTSSSFQPIQTRWRSKTINEQVDVLVMLGEPCLSEGHDAAVAEVLLKMNISLESVHFVPQGLDVPHDCREQRNQGELFPQV